MKTILYVDDEFINLELFRINYNSEFQIITALSGKEGLQKMKDYSDINVVFSDMKMPEMNGLEFIRKIKESFPEIPCYILTGYDITSEIKQAIATKTVDNYYQKPLDFKQIRNELTALSG